MVLILEAESTPGHMVLSVATKRIPSDTNGNRSRDRPTSSAVLIYIYIFFYSFLELVINNSILDKI
jgi:hypothetical protein